MTNSIPEDWIKHYVDVLIASAAKLEPSKFRDAILLRAEHAMDLVKAYRDRENL